MDISDAPFLDWRVLNDHTQIASKTPCRRDRLAVPAGTVSGEEIFEFCWVPVDDPDQVDVNRPGVVGDFWPWKQGGSYANGSWSWKVDEQALFG